MAANGFFASVLRWQVAKIGAALNEKKRDAEEQWRVYSVPHPQLALDICSDLCLDMFSDMCLDTCLKHVMCIYLFYKTH